MPSRAASEEFAQSQAKSPPSGVPPPPEEPDLQPSKFGFVENAEVQNSRAAMVGFFALLFVEGVTGKALLELIGFRVGFGLNIPI